MVNIKEGAIAASSHLEEPIRAERLEQHAESLAAATRTTEKPTKGRNLRRRVSENGQVLSFAKTRTTRIH